MEGFLREIVEKKREEIRDRKSRVPLPELRSRIRDLDPTRGFHKALAQGDGIRLIAEIKKASPSRGLLRSDYQPAALARIYEKNGASALSVLTDAPFFQGSLEDLEAVRRAVGLPLIRKDFTLDAYQIYEARACGADAILLIAGILSRSQIEDCFGVAKEIGLDTLLEVHTARELEAALQTPVEILGINNRDLESFEVRLETTFDLRPAIPPGRLVVSESGISTRQDVERLQQAGVHAILVGETFMRSPDVGAKVRELLGRSVES
ncbi:MAG: indole-3-glycerol phosphate synthase TrpC [Nitrospirae bacterium]|nr:indole-3-glycerol phosphate synthase TrpC [Nitrospirota bacterium]